MELQELDAAYRMAEEAGDLEGCVACQMQILALRRAHPEVQDSEAFAYQCEGRFLAFFAAAMLAYERGEARLAEYYLRQFPQELIGDSIFFREYRYALGRLAYVRGAFAEAHTLLEAHLETFPQDETAWLALGNAAYRAGRFQRASSAYAEALYLKSSLSAAAENRRRALAAMMASQGTTVPAPCEPDFSLGIDPEDWGEVRRLPIFINCRDRVTCVSRLVGWLLTAGYENIILLDNASTYAPLLSYYETIRQEAGGRVRIVRLGENLGHKALWTSGILELLDVRTPYVYTDPDVLPGDACPPRFLQRFARVLAQHPVIRKVGAALVYEDITYFDREKKIEQERNFLHVPIGDDVYFANVDTTFALYRNVRFYHRAPALRIGGACRFRHLPWYYDYDHLPEDEQYYMDHADISSSLKYAMTKGAQA